MNDERVPRQHLMAAVTTTLILTITALAPARASDVPSATDVEAAVSDHTYQGSMSTAGSGFAEYYGVDGSIIA